MRADVCRLAVLIAAVAIGGCQDTPKLSMPSLDPAGAGSRAMADYDANQDGAIAGDELEKCPGLKAALAVVDTNSDQRVTADEIAECVRGYQRDGAALHAVVAKVTLNQQPLSEAQVKLTPERFMGRGIKPAVGTTGSDGLCNFMAEGETIAGVQPGIYRIEVFKPDGSIPAKYNSQTTLGTEVSGQTAKDGLVLNLSK